MNRLKDLLGKVKDSNISDSFEDSQKLFAQIAEELMCNNIICKGDREYAIVEIEFYLYSPTHRDWITYPRNIDAGKWFFHQSGVDLTFGSQFEKRDKIITEDSVFGGILIRGIYDLKIGKYIFGPQKCVNELWQELDAFDHSKDYPIIKTISSSCRIVNLMCCKRSINIDKENKVKYWYKLFGSDIDVINYANDIDIYSDNNKYLYRYFNLRHGEDARKFSEISAKARPSSWYPVKTE